MAQKRGGRESHGIKFSRKSRIYRYGLAIHRAEPGLAMCAIQFKCLAPGQEAQRRECKYYEPSADGRCGFEERSANLCQCREAQLEEVAFAAKFLLDEREAL